MPQVHLHSRLLMFYLGNGESLFLMSTSTKLSQVIVTKVLS
jgi:hypothetical protein